MERTVLAYIQSHNMLLNGDSVVAGVSGGADSMCLLRILISLRDRLGLKKIVVVHVNHGIRGESADADEAFVKHYCEENSIIYEAVHADVPSIAKAKGLTEEEAGRNVRYEAFTAACGKYGCNKIAVAHNGDDNAETVLFNIARGSGISGLRGIAPTRRMSDDITLVRPLLNCSRAEIEQYLSEQNMTYRTDETNLKDDYSRNKIRHTVLPALCDAVNNSAADNIRELAARAAELEDFVRDISQKKIYEMERDGLLVAEDNKISIALKPLADMQVTLCKSILRAQLGRLAGKLKDIEAVHVESIYGLMDKQVGRSVNLPYGITARRDYSELLLQRNEDEIQGSTQKPELFTRIKVPGEYRLPDGRTLKVHLISNEKDIDIPQNDYTKYFDYDKIVEELTLRTRMQGDYLMIKGPGGGEGLVLKSLKTWFIDRHIPAAKRGGWPLLAEGPHILWVVGERGDDSCLVTESTRSILVVELLNF